MKNFSISSHLNKVWMLALVAFMVACSQMEAPTPDDANLKNAEDSAFSLTELNSGLWNAMINQTPTPVLFVAPQFADDFPGAQIADGGGNVNCNEGFLTSGRRDDVESPIFSEGWPQGFKIETDGTNVSWSFEPFIDKDGIKQCLKNLTVIVKGGPGANVYTYANVLTDEKGVASGSGLIPPANKGGQQSGLSNLTLCYNLEPCPVVEPCYEWKGETAWSTGSKYNIARGGNWATFTSRAALKDGDVKLFAGQTMLAGFVNSAGSGDGIEITITLNEGWRFKAGNESVKIQDYATGPSGNPSPGLFKWKNAVIVGNTATITVPINEFYGIHVDVEKRGAQIECPI